MKNFRINIIGSGAMGHLWYSYLTQTQNDVVLYSRTEKPPQQLKLVTKTSSKIIHFKYETFDNWQSADLILVCVKAHHLAELGKVLKSIVSNKCPLILMMNGMGLVERLSEYLPENPIYHSYLTHGAYLDLDALIHAGKGITSLGTFDSFAQPDYLSPTIELLHLALPPVTWSTTHQQDMHIKLVINAVINPLTALSGKSNGSVLTKGQLTPVAEELFKEILLLKEALSLNLSDKKLKEMIEEVAIKTANNRSSMLQDISNKKPTEIDYINGYLLKQAKAQGFDLPLNSKLVSQIKALEASYIKK